METKEVIDVLTDIMNDGGRYGVAAYYAIQLIQERKGNRWKMNMLLDKDTGLFNCGNCLKCWEAPRNSDLYAMGFKYCPNCGAQMQEGRG